MGVINTGDSKYTSVMVEKNKLSSERVNGVSSHHSELDS